MTIGTMPLNVSDEPVTLDTKLFAGADDASWLSDDTNGGAPRIPLPDDFWKSLEDKPICCFGGNLIYTGDVRITAWVKNGPEGRYVERVSSIAVKDS